MAEMRLERALRVPADPAFTAIGEILDAIAKQEGMWREFALHISLSDLHLPDVGYIAIPIHLTVTQLKEPRTLGIAFGSASMTSAFPTFKGRFNVTEGALGESTLILSGDYALPMKLLGTFFDAAFVPGVALRSLENFIDEMAAACQARVNQEEEEFARYHYFAKNTP